METLPLRAQDPRCDILGEHPPAHSGRTPQALASTQEEETAWQHRTRTRGMERQASPSHQEALRPPPQHFSRRSKFHSERFGAEPTCATQCRRIPFQACTQQATDTCTALHRNYGLAWAWARRQANRNASRAPHKRRRLHLPVGFCNKRRRRPPVPSPVHCHLTFFTPCHCLTGSSVPFNI